MANLATLFGVVFAYQAYGSWKKQITHPKQYERDTQAFKNLTALHDKIYTFANSKAYELLGIYIVAKDMNDSGEEFCHRSELARIRSVINGSQIDRLYWQFLSDVEHVLISDFGSRDELAPQIIEYKKRLLLYIKYLRSFSYKKFHAPYLYQGTDGGYGLEDLTDEGRLYIELNESLERIRIHFKNKWM
ncbi:hypothetical protein NB502_10370 [Vibrio diabolicus]|uniref:hypothetical protein n=1 Tax=Vibrio diabolicus TaxID=50719 RepID=UPI00215CA78C|nr:hypothetical protein [Vibrio diabolicus]MCR9472252.1 hypothetical protein [Vibrio diabolicus]